MKTTRRMTGLLALFLLLALPGVAAAQGGALDDAVTHYAKATPAETAPGTHQDFTLCLRPSYWLPRLDGDATLEDQGGNGTSLDTDSDLDLADEEGLLSGEVDLRLGDFDLLVSGFRLSRSGRSTVTRTIVFGDISVTGTSDLSTDLDFSAIGPRVGWAILGSDASAFRFGPTIGVQFVSVEIDVVATNQAGVQRERVDVSSPVPSVGLRLEVPAGDFLLTADARGMALRLDELEGTWLDVAGTLTWRPMDNLGVFLGYRIVRVDAKGESGGNDYDVDLTLQGPVLGAEIRF